MDSSLICESFKDHEFWCMGLNARNKVKIVGTNFSRFLPTLTWGVATLLWGNASDVLSPVVIPKSERWLEQLRGGGADHRTLLCCTLLLLLCTTACQHFWPNCGKIIDHSCKELIGKVCSRAFQHVLSLGYKVLRFGIQFTKLSRKPIKLHESSLGPMPRPAVCRLQYRKAH